MAHQRTIKIAPGGHVEKLRQEVDHAWNRAVRHKFVNELFTGELPDKVLATYLIQDYHFFEGGLSQIGACVAFASSLPAKIRFAKQLGFLGYNENNYFEKSLHELGVSAIEIENSTLTDTTKSYIKQMTDTTNTCSYPELLAMIVVAEWIYLDWGQLHLELPPRSLHREWIELHRGDSFFEWTQFLVDELEKALSVDKSAADRVSSLFRKTVELEGDFFDDAFRN